MPLPVHRGLTAVNGSWSSRKGQLVDKIEQRNDNQSVEVEAEYIYHSLQSMMDEGRSCEDNEGILYMINKVFQCIAPKTAFFSESSYQDNLEKLTHRLNRMCKKQQADWKQDMFVAVKNNDLDKIARLLSDCGFNLNSTIGRLSSESTSSNTPKVHTALTLATWLGNLALVKYLLGIEADPKAMTSEGLSAIHIASMRPVALQVLQHFVEQTDLNVDYTNAANGTTPLMVACENGNFETVEYLLDKAADINFEDNQGQTAIFFAVRGGHLDLLKLLVARNACVSLRDNFNATLLHHLVRAHERISSSTLGSILNYLIETLGISVNYQEMNGNTALHEACRHGLYHIAKYLMDNGATVDLKKDKWETPLWSLVLGERPNPEIVALLFDMRADFNLPNLYKMTPHQYVLKKGCTQALCRIFEDKVKMAKTARVKKMNEERRQMLSGVAPPNTPTTRKPFKEILQPVKRKSNNVIKSNNDTEICDGDINSAGDEAEENGTIIKTSNGISAKSVTSVDCNTNIDKSSWVGRLRQVNKKQSPSIVDEDSTSNSSSNDDEDSSSDDDCDIRTMVHRNNIKQRQDRLQWSDSSSDNANQHENQDNCDNKEDSSSDDDNQDKKKDDRDNKDDSSENNDINNEEGDSDSSDTSEQENEIKTQKSRGYTSSSDVDDENSQRLSRKRSLSETETPIMSKKIKSSRRAPPAIYSDSE